MARIVLDFAIEVDDELGWEEQSSVLSGHGLRYEIMQEEGPGGGWPEVEVTGNIEDIKRWLVAYCSGDEDQAYDLEDLIEG